LVVIRMLAQAPQKIGGAVRHGTDSVLIAVDDGTNLDDPEFSGADLIVTRAAIGPAANVPADSEAGAA
jgi:hypothetical protein